MTKITTVVFAKTHGQTANLKKNGCNAPVALFAAPQEIAFLCPVNALAGHILTALTLQQNFFVNIVPRSLSCIVCGLSTNHQAT